MSGLGGLDTAGKESGCDRQNSFVFDGLLFTLPFL